MARIIWFCWSLWLPLLAGARPPVLVLPAADTALRVWPYAELLEDPTQRLSLQEVMAQQQPSAFSSTVGRSTQLGFSPADYWLRFRVRNDDVGSDRSWVLHIVYFFANQLTLYLVDETTGLVQERHTGEGTPMSAWDMPYQEGALQLKLHPHRTYTAFLRLAGNNSKSFIPMIRERPVYHNFIQWGTYWLAIYEGILLFSIVIQLIFFGFTKERNFILYALYILAIAFTVVQSGNGLPGEVYFWPDNDWLNRNGMVLSTAFFTSFGLTFYANGLKLRIYSRSLFWIFCGLEFFVLLLTALVLLDIVTINATQYTMVSALSFLILILLSSLVSLVRGFKPARYYLLATLSFLISLIILSLWHQGLIRIDFLTSYCIPIGNLSELVFFTLALADDYRRTQRHERESQQQLIETLREQNEQITEALLNGQTLERQRVAADLHDNLGTTLSSLNWTLQAIDTRKLSETERTVYQHLTQQVNQAYTDVRLLSHNLLPAELEKRGLPTALQLLFSKLNRNKAIAFTLDLPQPPPRYDRQTEFEVYSICLELANNILKHAQATRATIALTDHNGQLLLAVSDNGVGLAPADEPGKGLQNVQARVTALGGTWAVESEPGQGTVHRITVPVRTEARVA